MAGFLESIGRTNTLSSVTNDISRLAGRMRGQDLQERDVAMRENLANIKMQEVQAAQKRDNTIIPVSQFMESMPIPAVNKYLHGLGKGLGYIEDIGGEEGIRAGNARELFKIINTPEQTRKINDLTLQHFRESAQSVNAEIEAYKQSKQGKDLSADKTLQQMMQAKAQVGKALQAAMQGTDKLDTYEKISKEYTPEAAQRYMREGTMPTPQDKLNANQIVKSIDLDNGYVQHEYGDGRTERVRKEEGGSGEKWSGSYEHIAQLIDKEWPDHVQATWGLKTPPKEELAAEHARWLDEKWKMNGKPGHYEEFKRRQGRGQEVPMPTAPEEIPEETKNRAEAMKRALRQLGYDFNDAKKDPTKRKKAEQVADAIYEKLY